MGYRNKVDASVLYWGQIKTQNIPVILEGRKERVDLTCDDKVYDVRVRCKHYNLKPVKNVCSECYEF